ncbi:outer membrane protein assembly factor BamB family protein [Streptomyces sp. 900105245]
MTKLSEDLVYSRARLSEFLSGSSVPSLQVVEQLVRITVPDPVRRAEQLKRVQAAHAAAVKAPASAGLVVVEPPSAPAQSAAVADVQSQLVAAQRTIIELQEHKARTEKLLLFLVTVNTVLRHRMGRNAGASAAQAVPEHPAVVAALGEVVVRGEDLASLQRQVAGKIAHAGAVVRRIEILLVGARAAHARLEEELEDLRARGVPTLTATPSHAPAAEQQEHTQDVLDVLARTDAMLQDTEASLDRLEQQVSAHQTAVEQPPGPGLDNPPTSENTAEQLKPGRPSRRKVLLAAAATAAAGVGGYGVNVLVNTGSRGGSGAGGPTASATSSPVKSWSWTHATGHAVYLRPAVTGNTLLTIEGPLSASASGSNSSDSSSADDDEDAAWVGYAVDALDIRTGQALWRGHTALSDMLPPARDGRVFLTSMWQGGAAGQLIAYNAISGKRLWTYGQGPEQLSIAHVSGDTVYVCSTADNAVHAVHASSGHRIWKTPVTAASSLMDPLADYDGILYFRAGDGTRFALDASTGKVLWSVNIQDAPVCFAGPGRVVLAVNGDGDVYVNRLRCVHARTGKTLWKVTLPTGSFHWPGTYRDNTLYLTDTAGALSAYSATTGKRLWRTRLGSMTLVDVDGVVLENDYHSRYCAPALHDGTLYVGTSLGLHAVDTSSGHQKWRHLTTGPVLAPPVPTARTVYATSQGGTVYALDTRTGNTRWSLTTRSSLFASPAVTDTRVAVVDDTGYIYGLNRAQEHTPS